MASYRATTARRIQICLFLIELSLAVTMAATAYILLKFLSFGMSRTARIFSTLLGLWIIKWTILALHSLKNRYVYEGSDENDIISSYEENDCLKPFQVRHERRMKSHPDNQSSEKGGTFKGGKEDKDRGSNFPSPSEVIKDTKQFLMGATENELTTKISFPLLALLATVLLQYAARLLVIVQKFMRYFCRWRGRSPKKGLIQFSAIPFTIGRSMSPSVCSFHVFSFLNAWLEDNGDDHSSDCSPDAHAGEKMALQAVSFDRISINSAAFSINPKRQYPASKNESSWVGLTFEDVDMSLTILLKRKGRRISDGLTEKGALINDACVQSMTVRLKLRALEIGIFPCPLDWWNAVGVQIDANAIFHDKSTDSGKQSSLSGFGMSVASSQLNMYRFSSLTSLEERKANPQNGVLSWDKIESSLHLLHDSIERGPRRDVGTYFMLPSGLVVSHVAQGSNTTMEPSSTSPSSIKVYVKLGDFLCDNQFAFGVHLKELKTIIQSMDLLLRNMSSSLICGSSPKSGTSKTNKESRKKSPIKIVELEAVISMHVFSLLSTARGTNNAASLDYFSFGAPHVALHWRNDFRSVFDAGASQIAGNIERRPDGLNPLLAADARNASLRCEFFSGGRLDDSSTAAFDLILLNGIKSHLTFGWGHINLGGIFARADGEVVNKLACMKRASLDTKVAAANLRHSAKKTRHALSGERDHFFSPNTTSASQNRKQDVMRRVDISCDSIDAIIELLGSSQNTGAGPTTNDGMVRMAVLSNGQTSVTILTCTDGIHEEPAIPEDSSNSDFHLPDQLFDLEVRKCAKYILIEATAANVEGSLTFSPHSTLPVVDIQSADTFPDGSLRKQETTIYVKVAKLASKSAIPMNHSCSLTMSSLLSRAVSANFEDLKIYERYRKRGEVGQSLFSIPVHEFPFSPNLSETHHGGWRMAQAYSRFTSTELVKMVQCNGNFCRVEKKNDATGEKTELISIQFTPSLTAELEIIWSAICQWILISCSNRIKHAIAHLKAIASKTLNVRALSSHKTNIVIAVDPNVTANIYLFTVKSLVHTIIDGGSTTTISTAKYPSCDNACLKQLTKPNISFYAKHIELQLNNSTTSTFTFEDISIENFLRRANINEIKNCIKENSTDVNADDLATDHDGYPLKENFHLRCNITAKFPPNLDFGEVIDDIVLLPKALAAGLNCLKALSKKPSKKHHLMSIKCIIPFLDVSLMGNDPDAEHSTPTNRAMLRDEFRICLEATEVSIERNAPPEQIQSQLNALDEDNSSTYLYGPGILGGLTCITIQHVFCTLHPLNLATPLVRIDDFAINGHLLLAGLSPANPGIQDAKAKPVLLLCHHIFLGNYNHRKCCCCYGVSMKTSTSIPVKLYADSRVTCGRLDISYGPIMKQSMPRLKESFKRILPPPKFSGEVATVPLSWWDNLRFFVHGSISVDTNELSFRWLLDSHVHRDQSVVLNLQSCIISHKVGLFRINASNIIVSIPGAAYDMSVHPSARDMKPIVHLPHATESVVTEGRHPLIYVPSFKTDVKFFWNVPQPGHHYIYMNRESVPNSADNDPASIDKFGPFRSDGIDIEVDLELMGSDVCDNWVALRMDVLPWFTHLNSSLTYSTQKDEDEPDRFPELRSAAIKASTSKLRVATWFEDDEDFDSLCLILKQVNYNATADGSKEISIEGPVQAALLDVSAFKDEENVAGDCHESNDLMDIECIASGFGMSQSENESDLMGHSSPAGLFSCEKVEYTPFLKLQQISCDIESELDYVVVTGQIDIHNQSITNLLEKHTHKNLETTESQNFAGVDRTTWSILVSRLRLLWTIEIRDSLMAISKDLIYTIGFMKSQNRHLQVLSGNTPSDSDHKSVGSRETSFSLAGEGIELSLPVSQRNDSAMHDSMLEYLLQENSKSFDKESFDEDWASMPMRNPDEKEEKKRKTLPTLDIQFANPQVQLHSVATGGSIILAMEGAHVEGRKFVHFLVRNSHRKNAGKVSLSDLLRKTEHTYTLTNMEAYSLNAHVDPNMGLPWLNVCSHYRPVSDQAIALEERFGIYDSTDTGLRSNENRDAVSPDNSKIFTQKHDGSTSSQKYPSYLRHHEPLAFAKSGLLRPILGQFTFQSRQLFHRPPIHYSTEELICFVKQGLVVRQDEAVVDDIELQIDLLNFNLDSYQFKTTIDVIRNVLLEPPKPHQRHQSSDQDETDSRPKASERISSVAATEMEEALRNHNKQRGKKGRQMLRSAAMNLLRDLEDKIALNGNVVFRRVSYTLSKLTWCIQSQGELDDVQIAFTSFNGQHDYSRDGSIVSQFSLEDLRVSSSRPGPDSIVFPDPTSVVSSLLGNERSPCQRCGQNFDHSKNDFMSCIFHSGQFRSGAWTCCNSTDATSPGCKSGPHTGKERAAVIRVESLPRMVDGISLFSHFEINLFPGILHTLVVQISKSFGRLFMSYFFPGDDDADDQDDMSTHSDVTGSTATTPLRPDYSPKPTGRGKKMLTGVKESPSIGSQRILEETPFEFDSVSEVNLPKEETKKNEIAFIKVWRIGNVDVNVSFGGFKRFPQTSLDLSVPAYRKSYKIGTWEYLGRKYLTYLVHEVFKSGASSGLDKLFRRKGSSPSPGQMSEQSESTTLRSNSYCRSAPPMPHISDSSPLDLESFIGRHLRRSMGASDILGTPAKHSLKKRKKIAFKHKDKG